MFHHEASMHQYLSRFPDTPVVRLKEMASIKPKTMASLVPSMSFGVVVMDLVDGYPISKLKELCMLDRQPFQDTPEDIRKLIPTDKESARRLFTELNHLIQFPISVGVQSRDPNLDNIMCTAKPDGKGIRLTWIDVTQFQPLKAKQFRRPESSDDMKKMCLVRYDVPVNELFEEDMYDNSSFLFRKAGCSGAVVHDLKIRRFRDFGVHVSTTFAWRLVMEDICLPEWQGTERPVDARIATLLIRTATKIMVREGATSMRQSRPGSGIQKQDCFHRAVLKLYLLLYGPFGDESCCKTAALDAVLSFEDLMAKAGYPGGTLVVTHDLHSNAILMDKSCIIPKIENVVDHSKDTRIFPTRFWLADWSFERIQVEVEARFEKTTTIRAATQGGDWSVGLPESGHQDYMQQMRLFWQEWWRETLANSATT